MIASGWTYNKKYFMEDIDVCRSSNTHNNMICLSCHGPNDLTLGYVSRDSSLIIGQLEWIKLFYLYKCNRIEKAIINTSKTRLPQQ